MTSHRFRLASLFVLVSVPFAAARGADLGVTATVVTSASFPTHVAQAPGDPSRIYYCTRFGTIRIVHEGTLLDEPFLDLTTLVGDPLACLVFHPDFQRNGHFFVLYKTPAHLNVMARYTATDPDHADPASAVTILEIPQSLNSHSLNWAAFGPDGYLYVSKGDGGAATNGINAQDLPTLHGKILRLDVDGATPYAIPTDNPFVGRDGLDEIWAYGLRNAWRCSFDRQTGDLWIADVGDATREEFSMQPAGSGGGENYGWNCTEGSICHAPSNGCTCGDPTLVEPLYDYPHSVGCAIIGGYVYRGAAIPSLRGLYVFADSCSGQVQAYDPATGELSPLFTTQQLVTSFGESLDGELFAATASAIMKLVVTDCNGNGVPDVDDIGGGGSIDCNDNAVPDECEGDCNGNDVPDDCDIADGTSDDADGNGVPDECDDAIDLDGDGVVGTGDLLILLSAWGPCGKTCPADLDGNGAVGTSDLLILLGNWG